MNNEPPTKFTESNALLAVMSDDQDEARRILLEMNETELWDLYYCAKTLTDMALAYYWGKHDARRLREQPDPAKRFLEDL